MNRVALSPRGRKLTASVLACVLASVGWSCSRSASPEAARTATGDASSAAPTPTHPAASPPSPAVPASQGVSGRWSGTYASKVGSFYVPDASEYAGFRWRGDDAGAGLGSGSMTLRFDPSTHRLTGELEGPLGPALLYGTHDGKLFQGTIARRDPHDDGPAGTFWGDVTGSQAAGTMRLSSGQAALIREASFQVSLDDGKPEKPPAR